MKGWPWKHPQHRCTQHWHHSAPAHVGVCLVKAGPFQRQWLLTCKPGLEEEKGMVSEGSVCPGVGSFPPAWSERALQSATASPAWELLRGEAVVCWAGGESQRDHDCSPVLVQGEGGGFHSPHSPPISSGPSRLWWWSALCCLSFSQVWPALSWAWCTACTSGHMVHLCTRQCPEVPVSFQFAFAIRLQLAGCPKRGMCVLIFPFSEMESGCRVGV